MINYDNNIFNSINNNNTYKNRIDKNKMLLNNLLNFNLNNSNKSNKEISSIQDNNSINTYSINNNINYSDKNININNKNFFSLIFNKSTPNFYHGHAHDFSSKNNNNKKDIVTKSNKKIYQLKRNIIKEKNQPFLIYKQNNKINEIKKSNLSEKISISSRNNNNNINTKKNKSTKNKNYKTNKNNNKIINEFFTNLTNNEKSREEKIHKLTKLKEEKIDSIYTFSPKLIPNKNNKKYLKKLIDKLFMNNIIDSINNKTNNTQNNKNINNSNESNNKDNKLDIVLEENRKNINFDFISRLNEYEKRRINNLEKIKNDIYLNQYKNYLENNYFNNNDKYNIEDCHLLNATYSYFSNKKRNIEKITKDMHDEQGITFKPKLNNEYNDRIIKNYKEINLDEYLNKKNEKIFDYLSTKDKECTFHPKINNKYDLNCNNCYESDVSERLLGYQNKYREKIDLMRSKYCNFAFKPKISKNTNTILNKKKLINDLKIQIKLNMLNCNSDTLEKHLKSNDIPDNQANNLEDIIINKEINNKENITPIFNIFSNKDNKDSNNITNNKNNLYLNINNSKCKDYKLFLLKNDRSPVMDKDNNIKNKIMNFEYYDNIL